MRRKERKMTSFSEAQRIAKIELDVTLAGKKARDNAPTRHKMIQYYLDQLNYVMTRPLNTEKDIFGETETEEHRDKQICRLAKQIYHIADITDEQWIDFCEDSEKEAVRAEHPLNSVYVQEKT